MSEENARLEEFIRTKMDKIGYSDIPKFVRNALYFEVPREEARSLLHERYTGTSSTKDQDRYFDASWGKLDGKVKTYSQYREEGEMSFTEKAKARKAKEAEAEREISLAEREIAFEERTAALKRRISIADWLRSQKRDYSKTSDFMLKVFDEDDIIWASHDPVSYDAQTEMKDMLSWSKKRENLASYCFFSINPYRDCSARKKSNVKKFRYMLLEADEASKETQFLLWIDLIERGLPVKMIVHTGNKSLHCLVKLPASVKTLEDYEEYVGDVFRIINGIKSGLVDEACKNPDRLSRMPFGIRNDEKTDFDSVEQKLIYLQEDDSKLQNDARAVLAEWSRSIYAEEKKDLQKRADEISDDELLSFVDRDVIYDIWDDGQFKHTLMKQPHFNKNGSIVQQVEDMKWKNDKSFYSFIKEKVEEASGVGVTDKELRALKVRFKTAEKFPFVGEKMAVKRDIVNTFIPGWLHQALNDDSIPCKLDKPLEILLDNIFGNDAEARTWVLQWMREFMHSFNAITAPVFWEIPGTGKTMLATCFGEAVGDWIKTPPKKDDIQFNAWQDHTVVIFEESSSGSKRDGKDLGDLLKDWLTECMKTIEAKGKDPVKKLVKSCYIFNANVSDQIAPVFIEDNDRRYTIVRNDDAKNLIELWSREDFDRWESGELQKQLMKWIYMLPEDESVNVRKGLDNEWKKEVIKLGKNNIEIALMEIAETYEGFISNAELLDKVRREYGISATSRASGNILIKMGHQSIVKWENGAAVRGYIFGEKTESAAKEDSFKALELT